MSYLVTPVGWVEPRDTCRCGRANSHNCGSRCGWFVKAATREDARAAVVAYRALEGLLLDLKRMIMRAGFRSERSVQDGVRIADAHGNGH